MFSIRWILASGLLLGKYATGTSTAEEINFEVSNMKALAKNDPQVDVPHEMVENDEEDAGEDNFEDAESSPSEIVETRVLPEEGEPEEVNAQMKRPRRRRRRRRRKRPKPVANPEESEPYYTIPEDQTKRKPIKYRPQENVDVPVPEGTNIAGPARRYPKRRRRPLKRPAAVAGANLAEYVNSTEASPEESRETRKIKTEHRNQTADSQVAKAATDRQTLFAVAGRNVRKKITAKERENAPPSEVRPDSKTRHWPAQGEFSKPSTLDAHRGWKHRNESDTVRPPEETPESKGQNGGSPSAEHRELDDYHEGTEALKHPDEWDGTARSRKRPYAKGEYPTVGAKEVASEPTPSEGSHAAFKDLAGEPSTSEIKLAAVVQNASKFPFADDDHKTKHEDRATANDTNAKRSFKARRLPAISATLWPAKAPPVNDGTTSTLEESVSDEIREVVENGTRPTPPVDESHRPPVIGNRDFEFPIIIYAEGTHSRKVASTPAPAPATSSTRSTAFVYIPCNRTLDEVTKSKLNFTIAPAPATSTEGRAVTSSARPQHDLLGILGPLALEELEKRLRRISVKGAHLNRATEMRNDSNGTLTTPSLVQVDAGALGTHPNRVLRNSTNTNSARAPFVTDAEAAKPSTEDVNFRQPKRFQDTYKNGHETNEDVPFAKSYTGSGKESASTTSRPNSIVDAPETLRRENELSVHPRNNSFRRGASQEVGGVVQPKKTHTERKKLPLAVKSAILISGATLAFAVLGFFALLLSCKIRQAKSRTKRHRELCRERFRDSECRRSSRSTSPVVSKSNYTGWSFANDIRSNAASNRNYYLWQTLRKTFQYD